MRIAFFAPHKPIDHKVPSGDLMIGKGLHDYLLSRGHDLKIASCMRLRNVLNRPQKWPLLFLEYTKALKKISKFNPDIWLTYHSYYKSPDIFGPSICRKLGIPYVIYQGVFATKHRRKIKTWPGYIANKNALLNADHVFTNKEIDFHNLSRIILPEKLSRTRPGIKPEKFSFCPKSRAEIRSKLGLEKSVVIMSTAMLRDDVKAKSMTDLINAFALAVQEEPDARLIIAGDGEAKSRLESLAKQKASTKIIFLGKVPRNELYKYYSGADLFAFPGINEALGMVYLEAQSAGLPVVAYSTRGPLETVTHGETGMLSPEGSLEALSLNLLKFIRNKPLRLKMGQAGTKRINDLFNMNSNLSKVEAQLIKSGTKRTS